MATNPQTHWNAEVYERIGTPMRRWAQAVIDDLDLRGDETVLDAGCGSGSVTFDLLERLPRGRIYAVDSSPPMIEKLNRSIEERGETRIHPILADLTDFSLPEPADCTFSNAVLHWIREDDALFKSLINATRPGGRFRAQCGGYGNISRFWRAVDAVSRREPFSQHLPEQNDHRNYRTPERATETMTRAGWADIRARLFDSPVTFDAEEDAVLYLRTIILQSQVGRLPEELQGPYLRAVIAETIRLYGSPFTADYVRLDLWATRPHA